MRMLNTVRLTTTQKRVIAKIVNAATPKLASEAISTSENLIAARNLLVKLNIIDIINDEATLTQGGIALAQDEDIADAEGGLTQNGEELAFGDDATNKQKEPMQGGNFAAMESLQLLKELIKM